MLSCFRPTAGERAKPHPLVVLQPTHAQVDALVAEIASIVYDEQRLKIEADPTLAVPRRTASATR